MPSIKTLAFKSSFKDVLNQTSRDDRKQSTVNFGESVVIEAPSSPAKTFNFMGAKVKTKILKSNKFKSSAERVPQSTSTSFFGNRILESMARLGTKMTNST
jgi:hypothetical protein